jgi:hypothetical protein
MPKRYTYQLHLVEVDETGKELRELEATSLQVATTDLELLTARYHGIVNEMELWVRNEATPGSVSTRWDEPSYYEGVHYE